MHVQTSVTRHTGAAERRTSGTSNGVVSLDGEDTWQSPQQTILRSSPARGWLADAVTTHRGCARRLSGPAEFPVSTAGGYKISVRLSSVFAGETSPRLVPLR